MQKAGLGASLVASSLLLSGCVPDSLERERDKVKKETIDFIKKDISVDEYMKIMDEVKNHRNSLWQVLANHEEIQYWDSLKTDALCKKAYLEGAQMVRDSIANAISSESN